MLQGCESKLFITNCSGLKIMNVFVIPFYILNTNLCTLQGLLALRAYRVRIVSAIICAVVVCEFGPVFCISVFFIIKEL